jgi:hypothetical protein
MKCFYDPTQDAVGACKSCGRGLSHEHLTEMDKGLACRGRCEDDVRSLITLIDRNVSSSAATNQILKRSSVTAYGSGVFLSFLGAIFIIMGYRHPRLDFTFYMGTAFLIYGLWTLFRTYKYARIVAYLPDTTDTQP